MLPAAAHRRIPVGIAEADFQPVVLDFAVEPHLVVYGEPVSGRSSLLRAIARGVARANKPAEAIVAVIDFAGSLHGVVPEEQLIGHAGTEAEAAAMIAEIASALEERLPGTWRGPELYLLIDDLDAVAPAGSTVFAPLADLLAAPAGIGLHVVVARRTEGLDRAFYGEPLASLRKLSAATIRLAGTPPGRARYLAGHAQEQRLQLIWEPPAGD
jgi:S-DNA-T family DNA segregation ATPase FtsK/SpoIIIE